MLKTLVRMYRHAQTRHLQEDIYKTLDAGGFEERSMGKAELKQELPGEAWQLLAITISRAQPSPYHHFITSLEIIMLYFPLICHQRAARVSLT